jgi:hypothetical protein
MTRTLTPAGATSETQFTARRRRRTPAEMAAAAEEVKATMDAARAIQGAQLASEPVETPAPIAQLPDTYESPAIDGDFRADVIEFHQPIEIMGNRKTLNSQHSTMSRLADGSGDWLIQSKKTKHRYLLGGGNVKAVKLK